MFIEIHIRLIMLSRMASVEQLNDGFLASLAYNLTFGLTSVDDDCEKKFYRVNIPVKAHDNR